jgi:hypothetical protein
MTDDSRSDNRRHRKEDMSPEEWEAHCERMKARYAAAASNLMMFLDLPDEDDSPGG